MGLGFMGRGMGVPGTYPLSEKFHNSVSNPTFWKQAVDSFVAPSGSKFWFLLILKIQFMPMTLKEGQFTFQTVIPARRRFCSQFMIAKEDLNM